MDTASLMALKDIKGAVVSLMEWVNQQDGLGEAVKIFPATESATSTHAAHEHPDAVKPEYYVTLLQMAAILGKGKRTLERLKGAGKLPPPAVKGGKGKADEWRWSEVRSTLEKEFARQMPEVFPADRFQRV
jgi:hypothetical protein